MTTLFLKYRPQVFSDLVGQDTIAKTLKNALKNDVPAHAYLFCGSRGTGKTSTARIFAKALNCESLRDGDPCGECKICAATADGSLVDVIEIDAASNRRIDEMRDLREKVNFAPSVARRKVYIIDEVHMLTKEAFNALLKTLEEPPDHAFFCLATTELHKIPETIVSRCQSFIFQRFSIDQLVERLEKIAKSENFSAEKSALRLVAKKSEGGMRDAISLLEQLAAETENQITEDAVRASLGISSSETLEEFWKSILSGDADSALEILKKIGESGGNFRSFGHDFLEFLRVELHENLNFPERLAGIVAAIDEFEKSLLRLKTSPIVELPFEIAVVNLTTDFGRIESKVQKIEPKKESESATIHDRDERDENGSTSSEKPHRHEKKSLDETTISEKMPEIAEKSQIPNHAKRSFLLSTPKIDGDELIFAVDSNFHRDQLEDKKVKNLIRESILAIFGESISIKIVVEKTSTTPTQKSDDEVAGFSEISSW